MTEFKKVPETIEDLILILKASGVSCSESSEDVCILEAGKAITLLNNALCSANTIISDVIGLLSEKSDNCDDSANIGGQAQAIQLHIESILSSINGENNIVASTKTNNDNDYYSINETIQKTIH